MYCNNNNTSAQLPTVYSYVQCQSEGKASSRCAYCSDWMWPTEVSSASSVLASFPIHSALTGHLGTKRTFCSSMQLCSAMQWSRTSECCNQKMMLVWWRGGDDGTIVGWLDAVRMAWLDCHHQSCGHMCDNVLGTAYHDSEAQHWLQETESFKCARIILVWFLDNMRQDTQVSTFTWSDFWTVLCCHWPLLRLAVDCRISCWVAVYCINSYYWMFTLNISPLHSLEEVPHPSTHALSTHFVYLWLVIVLMYVYVHTKIVMSSLSTLLLYLAPLMAAVCTHASVLVWCKQYTTCTQDIICLHKGFPISQGVWVSSATPDIIFRYPHKISLNSWQAAVEKCLN